MQVSESKKYAKKKLESTENTERNEIQVDSVKSGLSDLKNEIKKMSEYKKKNRKTR